LGGKKDVVVLRGKGIAPRVAVKSSTARGRNLVVNPNRGSSERMIIKRGKEREKPKPKRKTKLKRIILAERNARLLLSAASASPTTPTSEDKEKREEEEGKVNDVSVSIDAVRAASLSLLLPNTTSAAVTAELEHTSTPGSVTPEQTIPTTKPKKKDSGPPKPPVDPLRKCVPQLSSLFWLLFLFSYWGKSAIATKQSRKR